MSSKMTFRSKVIIGILVIMLLIMIIPLYFLLSWKPRTPEGSTEATTNNDKTVVLHLQENREDIRGTDAQMLFLTVTGDDSDGGSIVSGKGYYQNSSRNILFLVGEDKTAHWLFPKNDQRVFTIRQLPDGEKNKDIPTQALLLDYADQDTNKDQVINDYDSHILALIQPNGNQLKPILKNVNRVISAEIVKDKVAIVYQIGKELRFARFNTATFEQELDKQLTVMPDKL